MILKIKLLYFLIAASAADRAAIIFMSLRGDIPRLQMRTRPPQFVRFCFLLSYPAP